MLFIDTITIRSPTNICKIQNFSFPRNSGLLLIDVFTKKCTLTLYTDVAQYTSKDTWLTFKKCLIRCSERDWKHLPTENSIFCCTRTILTHLFPSPMGFVDLGSLCALFTLRTNSSFIRRISLPYSRFFLCKVWVLTVVNPLLKHLLGFYWTKQKFILSRCLSSYLLLIYVMTS